MDRTPAQIAETYRERIALDHSIATLIGYGGGGCSIICSDCMIDATLDGMYIDREETDEDLDAGRVCLADFERVSCLDTGSRCEICDREWRGLFWHYVEAAS